MTIVALLFAAPLFSPDVAEPRRVKALRQYLDPPPGEALSLDPAELRDQGHKKKDATLRGFITVSPPKGKCFTVMRSEDEADDVVCKRTRLSFQLGDLDEAGRLHWRISTGDGDFGTPLTWASPYRVATFLDVGKKLDDEPTWRWIASCDAQRDHGERKITVRMASGERWVIRFPETDTPLSPNTDEPNLTVKGGVDKRAAAPKPKAEGAKNGNEAEKPKEAPAGEKAGDQTAAKTNEEKTEGEASTEEKGGEPAAKPASATPAAPKVEPPTSWFVPERDSYVMSADSFFATSFTTPGGPGICRYNYRGSRKDPSTGILECHDTDAFKVVVLPLTCLAELKP